LLFATNSTLVLEPLLHTNVGYDPQRDFAPITLTTEVSYLLVVPSTSRIKDLAGLLADASSRPGAVTYASWGLGSTAHLLGEMFKAATKVDIVHVPYKGEGPALMDLIGGQVSMMFGSSVGSAIHVHAGKLRALAVANTAQTPGMNRAAAITYARVGAEKLWAGTVVIHPNAKTGAHHHGPVERVIYVVHGRARMRGAIASSTSLRRAGRFHLCASVRAAPGDQRGSGRTARVRAGAERPATRGREPRHRAGRAAGVRGVGGLDPSAARSDHPLSVSPRAACSALPGLVYPSPPDESARRSN
jgi:hypothetical protein